jgi:hypothetical protein
MNDKIVSITFPKCGTCVYAQQFSRDPRTKETMADCFGHPPTVILLGQTQTVLGQPALQFETFVPRVKDDRPACALYKRKTDFATAGSS